MRFNTPSSALVIAEMKPLLGYLTYAEGKLTAVQYRTLSPALLSGAAIQLSGDLKTAYLSHRSNHSVTRIGLADGRCQTLEGVGLSPRDVNLTPDGRYAVCANEGGDMTVLTLTEETMRIVARIPCKGSNCVVFAEE
jgi:6-phosphogluconolactonase (cycloisomerase 2 family)